MREDTALFTAFDDYKHYDSAEPEKNLMRAILKSAMDDMNKRGEAYREATVFFSSDDDEYLFSFRSICGNLDLCPYTIRFLVGLRPKSFHQVEPIVDKENEARIAA